MKKLLLNTFILCISFLLPAISKAQLNFADYQPLNLGSYWTYQNVADPTDTYTDSVFEEFVFNGNPAIKLGTDSCNYGIGYNDGSAVHYYASVQGCILNDFPDVSIGPITDGDIINLAAPTNFILFRKWDNLSTAAKNHYGIDPSLDNLLLLATYDSNFTSNSENSYVESNLSFSLPNYGVTGISWFDDNIGKIVDLDIDAATGNFGQRDILVDYHIAPEPVSSTLFIVGGATLGFRRFRKKFKK